MKRQARRLLALALTLIMTVSVMCLPALAQGGEVSEKEVFHYVSLGASNSNGYALHGYLTEDMYANPILSGAQTGTPGDISGYRRTPEYSYPALVRDYFKAKGYEVDHDQLAQSSMRVEELRFLLDPEFTTDEYMEWRFYDPDDSWTWWYSTLDKLREDYKESIAEADLITYDMGLNNFGVYLTNNLLDNSYGNDLHYVIGDKYADMFYSIRSQIESGIESLSLGLLNKDIFETLDNLTDTMAYAILGYCVNFDATMGIIRELNPDATVVVLNVQNIMAGLEASIFDVAIPLGDIMGIATNIANTYTSLLSPYADEYLYADTTENGRVSCFMDQLAAYNGDPATLDQDMRECMDVYDTTLPMYLKFRVAARIAASMGDKTAAEALTNKNVLNSNLPYFVEYCEKNCPELYARTVENAYDTIATLLQAGQATNPVPLDGLLADGDTRKAEDALVDGIRQIINDVTDANIAGGTFTDEEIESAISGLLSDDTMKTVAAIGVRANIGNTFFSHPNRQGCRELYDAIIGALENNIVGSKAFRKELETVAKTVMSNTVKFGAQFPGLLISKTAEAFGTDSETAKEIANNTVNTELIENIIYNKIGADNMDKLEKFAASVSKSVSELGKTNTDKAKPAVKLTRVPAKEASVLHAGNIEYYICPTNGRLYADAEGLNRISNPLSVVIPRVTVVSVLKSIFSF